MRLWIVKNKFSSDNNLCQTPNNQNQNLVAIRAQALKEMIFLRYKKVNLTKMLQRENTLLLYMRKFLQILILSICHSNIERSKKMKSSPHCRKIKTLKHRSMSLIISGSMIGLNSYSIKRKCLVQLTIKSLNKNQFLKITRIT